MKRPIFGHKTIIEEMLRVNYAGEYGAVRIYDGQVAATEDTQTKELMLCMRSQETEHLQYFEQEMKKGNIRPSFFMHMWHYLGFGLGYFTALVGKKQAMICTESVETIIEKHYMDQIHLLKNLGSQGTMLAKIEQFRQEEIEHKDIASQDSLSQNSIIDRFSASIIRSMCRASIGISRNVLLGRLA